jgi:hypothetical protein
MKQSNHSSSLGDSINSDEVFNTDRRLIAILLAGGEAHDCPVTERLICRVKPPKRMLGDKAYDSAELREARNQAGHSKPQQSQETVQLLRAPLSCVGASRVPSTG